MKFLSEMPTAEFHDDTAIWLPLTVSLEDEELDSIKSDYDQVLIKHTVDMPETVLTDAMTVDYVYTFTSATVSNIDKSNKSATLTFKTCEMAS